MLVPTPSIGWATIPAMANYTSLAEPPGTNTNPGESTGSLIVRYDILSDGPELYSEVKGPNSMMSVATTE